MPAGSVTAVVAGWSAGLRLAELPPPVIEAARRCLVDGAGVLLAGAGSTTVRRLQPFAARRGVRSMAGCPLNLTGPSETVALLLGAAGHALDFDDGAPGAVHAGVPVLAALLGLGARPGSARLIEAFVVGWEVTARSARALGLEHYRRGWHTTGTAGTLGATAACCRYLELDAATTAMALGLAASSAAGLRRNFGTDGKPLHSGLAARNGVLAAELAALGLTAAPDTLDGARGMLDLLGGDGARPAELAELGRPFALTDPGAILKAYPCCYAAARGVDAARRLRSELLADGWLGVSPAKTDVSGIEAIECAGPVRSFLALNPQLPSTGLAAKFSLPYAVAAALLDDLPTLDSFTDQAVSRPAARELMARTTVAELERCRPADPHGAHSSPVAGGFVEVVVRTSSGRRYRAEVAVAHGAPSDPLSWGEIEAKYQSCASYAGLSGEPVAKLLALLKSIPSAGAAGDFPLR